MVFLFNFPYPFLTPNYSGTLFPGFLLTRDTFWGFVNWFGH